MKLVRNRLRPSKWKVGWVRDARGRQERVYNLGDRECFAYCIVEIASQMILEGP